MLLLFLFTVLLNPGVNCETIYSNSYDIISPPEIHHNLQNVFDDDLDSSSNVYIQTNRSFTLAIELQEECLIHSVSILTEHSNNTAQEIEVGYKNTNGRQSIKYYCRPSSGGYVCQFPCTVGNGPVSFAGKYIFWTMRQVGKSAWTRVNGISVQGSFIRNENMDKSKVDVVFQKPFAVQDILVDDKAFCDGYYWKLLDKSPPRHTYEEPKNLTVYFGGNYILKELKLVLLSKNKEEFDFYFGSINIRGVKVNVNDDCDRKDDFEDLKHYNCSLSSLGNLPLDQIRFSTDNISKLSISGIPVYYPSLSLSTSEVTVASGRSAFEITCTSVTCARSCQPPGEVETCQNLMLLRTQIHGGPTTLVAQRGQLEPLWADVLGDLKVLVDEESKMVVRIPRTHTYAGQYQCGCEATDATGTIILSVPTTFRSTDFLTEAIFQRNYTVVYRGKQQYLRDGGGGVIELATEGKGAFFHMMASGITLAPNLRTRVEWSEEGKRKTHETVYSREERVKLYPDVEALTNWTELANRVQARAVYPDARENETVIYRWSLSNQMPGSDVTDVFHLVDVKRQPLDLVRAWVVSKTDALLHIRVYCLHSESNDSISREEVKVELLSHGCDLDAAPILAAAFGMRGNETIINKSPAYSRIDVLSYGQAVNLFLDDYSTFYRYELQAIVGDNRTTLLDVIPSGILRLKDELEAAKFDVSVTKFFTTPESDEIRVEIQVEILSPVLLDHLNCTRGSLELTPAWNPENRKNVSQQRYPSLFDFTAPKTLNSLTFEVAFLVGKNTRSTKIRIPNPHLEKIIIEFDNTTGILSWDFVSAELRPAVKEYVVLVSFKDIGCGTMENLTLNYLAALNCTKTGGCTTHLWGVEQLLNKRDILANYTITIIPQYFSFDDNQPVLGTPSQLMFTYGVQGHSTITMATKSSVPRAQAVNLQPFRKVPCENAKAEEMDATFQLTAYAILAQGKVEMPLEGVEYKKLFPNNYGIGGTYKVSNLQPGREYRIKGFLKYPGPLSDLESAETAFTTPDEILVPEKHVVKDVGTSLLFNCSAAVGTDPKFQKEVRWLRADGELMPEGAFSRTAAFPDANGFLTASLSIPRVDDIHAGVYCCSPEPPVEHFYGKPPHCAEFRLIVNDLKLDRYELEANPGMAVSVTCSTKREGNLQWRRPHGEVVLQTHHTAASKETRWVQSLSLLLPEVNTENVGDYQCWFQPNEGEKRAPETFTLRLKEALTVRRPVISADTLRFGEITTLTCASLTAGMGPKRLRWYRYLPAESSEAVLKAVTTSADGLQEVIEETNVSNEVILRVRLTPTAQGRYTCVEFPEKFSHLSNEEYLPQKTLLQHALQHTSTEISYRSAVAISNPSRLNDGGGLSLRCTGYPSLPDERLEWAFKAFTKESAYVFDDRARGLFTLADNERISHIMSCFRPNLTKVVANWPGVERENPQSTRQELYSPDEIEIDIMEKFMEDPVCQGAVGQLVCQYRRLNAPLPFFASAVAMLPEFGLHPIGRQLSSPTAEEMIPLDAIRDAFDVYSVQGSSSQHRSVEKNGSLLPHPHQTVAFVLLLLIFAAFHFV